MQSRVLLSQQEPDADITDELLVCDAKFFFDLHQLESKYIKIKYSWRSKQTDLQIMDCMTALISKYADCVSYFSSKSEEVAFYFQSKIKDISQHYEHIAKNVKIKATEQIQAQINDHELGSLDQASFEYDFSSTSQSAEHHLKENLNKNVMACLQSQDVQLHIGQSIKKAQKMRNKIENSLKQQQQLLEQRRAKKQRKIGMSKSKSYSASLSSVSTISPQKYRAFPGMNPPINETPNKSPMLIQDVLFGNDIDSDEQVQIKKNSASHSFFFQAESNGIEKIDRRQLRQRQLSGINELSCEQESKSTN